MSAPSTIADVTTLSYPRIAQPKLDGIRGLIKDKEILSKRLKLIPNQFIQKTLRLDAFHGLDGELMLRTPTNEADFNSSQSEIMTVKGEPDFVFRVFDRWSVRGDYMSRYATLFDIDHPRIEVVRSTLVYSPEELVALHEEHVAAGYEGTMTRSLKGFYKYGQSTLKEGLLVKLKDFKDDEGKIVGWKPRYSNTNAPSINEVGRSVRSKSKDGLVEQPLVGALEVDWKGVQFDLGAGIDDDTAKRLYEVRGNLTKLPVTFKYQSTTASGKPRFPVFKAIRLELLDDLPPWDI